MLPRKHPFAAIVFDLDDTLYPESDYVRSGFLAVDLHLKNRDLCATGEFFDEAWNLFNAGKRGNIFDAAIAKLQIKIHPETVLGLVNVYRNHVPTIKLFHDAIGCLDLLSRHFLIGIITDGPAISQRKKFLALGLSAWVSKVVYSDEYGIACRKPHPRPFQEMESRFTLPSQSMVYVGDNPAKDFLGARGVGWRSIRIRREGTLHSTTEPVQGYEPDFELESLSQLGVFLVQNRL